MSKPGFLLYSQGFFLYPYTGDKISQCRSIAVPFSEGHEFRIAIARHRGNLKPNSWQVRRLAMNGGRFSFSIEAFDKTGKAIKKKPATIWASKFNKNGEPAKGSVGLENFNLLADSANHTPGAKLRDDWEDDLWSKLDLHGGEITAVPDDTTFSQYWPIPGKGRQIHSNLVRYASPLHSGVVKLAGEAFEVTSESLVVMFHVVPKPVQGKAYSRGIDHNASVMKLCKERATVTFSMFTKSDKRDAKASDKLDDFVKLVNPARKAAGLAAMGAIMDPGTPSCSGRKIRR